MSGSQNTSMTIGSLANAAEINVETIRYYQRLGLMTEPEKPLGGELLKLEDGTHCDEAKALGGRKLGNVRDKIRSLQQIEGVLDQLVEECCTQKDNVSCPLIASLHEGFETVTQ